MFTQQTSSPCAMYNTRTDADLTGHYLWSQHYKYAITGMTKAPLEYPPIEERCAAITIIAVVTVMAHFHDQRSSQNPLHIDSAHILPQLQYAE